MKRISVLLWLVVLAADSVWSQNKVLSLDGDGDYVEVTNNQILNFGANDSLTLEVWVNTLATKFIPLSKRVQSRNATYAIEIEKENGRAVFFVRDKNAKSAGKLSSTFPVNDGKWHHIAGVRDKQSNKLFLYVDGQLSSDLAPDSSEDLSNSESLFIGTHLHDIGEASKGEIDEVRIWNLAKTEDEIQASMNTILTGNETGLVSYWNFDDGTANDLTTNGNDGQFK